MQWIYSLCLEMVQYIANSLLTVFSMDLDYFFQVAPVAKDILSILIAAGWALLMGNLVFQAVRSMVSGLGFEGEDPKLLFTRTFVFAFLLLASQQICEIGLNISAQIIQMLQIPSSVTVTIPDESNFNIGASWLLIIIVGFVVMWQFVKLCFEVAERYVVTAVLVLMAPLAFGLGGSKSTEDIFKGWCRMFASMCLMMVMNIIFLKLLISAMGYVPSGLGVLPWMLLIVGIARVARKIDSVVARIGLNPAITGDGLGRGLPGMVAFAAIRGLGMAVTRSASAASKGSGGAKPPRRSAPAGGHEPPRRRKKKKKTPLWLPLAVTLAVLAVISGVVVYAVGMVGRVEENLRPEEDAPSITEEIQTLEEYKGDVVNILVCGIDYEEGRNYSNDPTSNDGMTDMILYCQFDIKGGALRMLQIPRNSLVATKGRKVALSNGKTYAATNYQINSVALSNGGSVAALAEVIYDQYKLPVDYYVTVDMQALVEMVDNFGGIEVYIPHDMSFAGSALKQGYRNLDGTSAEFFVRCRHGQGYSNSDIDRLNMQRYFYAGLFKRVRSMGITDVLNQLPLVFNNYIHTDMDLTTIAKMLVSFTRIDSANIMLAQTPVFMGVPNVGVTDTFDGYSCVVPDAGSIAELLNTYFRSYTGPVSASELNLVTNDWPHGTASTSANVQFVGQLDKESDDAILGGNTDVAGATTTDGQPAGQ